MADEQPAAKKKVAAVIGASVDRLDRRLSNPRRQWPKPGMPLDGVAPGDWREPGPLDDTGFLPEACPVRPLGYNGEDFYFVDTSGQVFCTGDKALGVERVQKLFAGNEDFLIWAWPSWPKGKRTMPNGFKAEEVRRDLYAACRARGPWTPTDRVRGRGAWLGREGRLVLHCGEYLFIDGKLEDTGEHGDHFYVRRPASAVPWAQDVDVEDNPAPEIFRALRSWSLERGDVDAMLLLGSIGVAMMGAALEWRPSTFIVGDAGTGKSELSGPTGLLRTVLGRSMLSTTNASEAGLYQIAGHDSLPIAVDELEGEDGIDQAQKIIKMARDAASGSIRIRGGADHKGVEFQAQSVFFFSAINPPGIPPASLSRLAIIQLNPLPADVGDPPKLKAPETIAPRLLRRIVDGWADWPRIYGSYRKALRDHGHNARGQKTFGSFLAAAQLLLGEDGMEALGLPWEDLTFWGEQLSADAVPELEDVKPTWLDCLERILTRPIDKFAGGQRQTPAMILDAQRAGDMTFEAAQVSLAAVDLGLVPAAEGEPGMMLAIPNKSDVMIRHLAGSPFAQHGASAGSWSWALRRAPPDICIKDKARNRVTVGGMQRRCTLIRVRAMREWLEKFG